MDCVALTKVVYHESGLIGKNLLQQFDHTQREPPIFRGTAEIVGNTAAEKWGVFPFNLDGLPEQ